MSIFRIQPEPALEARIRRLAAWYGPRVTPIAIIRRAIEVLEQRVGETATAPALERDELRAMERHTPTQAHGPGRRGTAR